MRVYVVYVPPSKALLPQDEPHVELFTRKKQAQAYTRKHSGIMFERNLDEAVSNKPVLIPEHMDCECVRAAVSKWLNYKKQRRQFSERIITNLGALMRNQQFSSPEKFCRAVEYSIIQDYQGLVPDPQDKSNANTKRVSSRKSQQLGERTGW